MSTFDCTGCGQPTDLLDEFPGRICLGCYEIEQIGAPMPTQQELLDQWLSPKMFTKPTTGQAKV